MTPPRILRTGHHPWWVRSSLFSLGIAIILGISAATATPPGHQRPPVAKKTPAPKPSSNPDPAQPAYGRAPAVPPPASIPPVVAETAPLGRTELIQLALHASPKYWRFRSEVALFTQAEAAAYDWEDPELRIGYQHGLEGDLERPYDETRSSDTTQSGIFDSSSNTFSVHDTGSGDASGITSESSTREQHTIRGRQIHAESVRHVIPGKYQDTIEETVYEVDRRHEREQDHRRGPGAEKEDQNANGSERRRVLSRTREIRRHPNSVYPDESFAVQVRFFILNPMVAKTRAAQARAERRLAASEMAGEAHDLMFDVGRRYDELQFWHVWHRVNYELVDLQRRHLAATEAEAKELASLPPSVVAAVAGMYDPADLPKARTEILQAKEEVFDSKRKVDEITEELCLLSSIREPGRIVLTNTLRLRKLDESQLDLPVLAELARANRADLDEIGARADIERAKLREVKARRIPWFNDVRVGWGRNISDGYQEEDEVTALLTMNLPLFSWWQNKAHRQHEAAIAGYEEARVALAQRVEDQVAFAIRSVRAAAAHIREVDRGRPEMLDFVKKNEADAAGAGHSGPRILLANDEILIKSKRSRLQAIYSYNQAVARLEQAVGLPIEEFFSNAPAAK